MDTKRLWAKSWDEERYGAAPTHVFLAGHLADVHRAATLVLDSTGDDQLRAVGLLPAEWRERFRRIVLLAAAAHDLGKANDHFQGMITRKRDVRVNPQGLRHEWVSLLMLWKLREWLLPAVGGEPTDFAIAEWCVAGHHPAHDHASPPRLNAPGAGTELCLLIGHPDFQAALQVLQVNFGLAEPPTLADEHCHLVGPENAFTTLASWSRTSQRIWEDLRKTPARRLVVAAKNCLIAADIAGSALPKRRQDWSRIAASFAAKPANGDLQAVVDERLRGQKLREFQAAVAASKSRITYIKAGCGSGKTLAAYMWAAANHPTRRLYFCYPTTGTATEGFKDYLFNQEEELPKIGAKLFHSRSEVDFEIILTTGRDSARTEVDAALRQDALESWSTPVVTCTVDTVLGLIQNNKRGLFAWPALAQSAFIFDEIHAFDDRLFGALLRFLRDLPGLPVLLMTASLPAAREEALRSLFEAQDLEWRPISGPVELEALPRYCKAVAVDNDPLEAVRDVLADKGKILWVCNTVARVLDAAARSADFAPQLYHSRFKYEDRVKRHKAVVEAFDPKKNSGRALAICSQVAEMSLDLSADLLVTDLATVPALIQRLGRLNRRASAGSSTKPFVVVEPDNHLPYTPADLDAARAWLAKLASDGITQRDLADCWEQTGDQPPDLVPSAWLDGGPITTVSELREASPGITVLMQEDLERVRNQPKLLTRLVLPMPPPPRDLNWREWPVERGIPIAPPNSIDYNPERGAQWQKK